MSLKRMFIDGEFGQMHVRMSEKNSQQNQYSLYCIHQSPSSSVVYNSIIMKLGNSRLVVAGDTPGFGESDRPKFLPEISDYAKAHAGILDKLNITDKVDLMGYFTGSKIAIELALQRPDKIRKLILFGIPIYTNKELSDEKKLYRKDEYTWDGKHLMNWWEHLKKSTPDEYPIELFISHFSEIQRGGVNSWWGHRAAFNYKPEIHLSKLSLPVLIFCTEDPQGYKSMKAERLIKNCRLINLPFKGQGALDLHTNTITKYMLEFLDDNE